MPAVVLGCIAAVVACAAVRPGRAPSQSTQAPRYYKAEIIDVPDWGGTDRGPMDSRIAAYDPSTAADLGDQIRARFRGTVRKAAKTHVAEVRTEPRRSIDQLLTTLVDDRTMLALDPPITRASDSGRVQAEDRSVRVRGWIYAIKYQDDQNWHLIVGTDPGGADKTFLGCEVSGLPSSDTSSYLTLLEVRQSLAHIFNNDLPKPGSYTKYTTPIPIEIEGMLLFDVDHKGGAVGPPGMRPTTSWTIQPITKIELGPPQPKVSGGFPLGEALGTEKQVRANVVQLPKHGVAHGGQLGVLPRQNR